MQCVLSQLETPSASVPSGPSGSADASESKQQSAALLALKMLQPTLAQLQQTVLPKFTLAVPEVASPLCAVACLSLARERASPDMEKLKSGAQTASVVPLYILPQAYYTPAVSLSLCMLHSPILSFDGMYAIYSQYLLWCSCHFWACLQMLGWYYGLHDLEQAAKVHLLSAPEKKALYRQLALKVHPDKVSPGLGQTDLRACMSVYLSTTWHVHSAVQRSSRGAAFLE